VVASLATNGNGEKNNNIFIPKIILLTIELSIGEKIMFTLLEKLFLNI
jgi:hypothetical protein